jgi:chemotaxis protein MotB
MEGIRRIIVVAGVAALATSGCSNKKLIAQKDAEITDLQGDVATLQADLDQQKQMNAELDRQLADLQEEKRVLMVEKDNLTYITLDGSATFPTASAELSQEGQEILDRIWDVVQQYPDRRILIEGHADSRPIAPSYRWKYASNWELSSARAHAVLHYLVDHHSADTSRLAAVGYGENESITEDTTPEGLEQNRRVVITIGSQKAMRQVVSQLMETSPTGSPGGR